MDEQDRNLIENEAPLSEEALPQTEKSETEPSAAPIPFSKLRGRQKGETQEQFVARYNAAKQAEMEELAKKLEDKNSLESKSKKRKWWIKTTLLLVLIVISVAIMFTMANYLSDDGTKSFKSMLKGISWPCLALFVGVVLLYMVLESSKYSYLLKISTGKWRLRNGMKTMFLGKYYDGITPLGTGGQPFQIYYLHKKDIPAGVATSIPLVRYIVATIMFCLLAIALFVVTGTQHWLNGLNTSWGPTTLLIIAIVSMLCNFLVPVVMLFVSLFPRFGKKFIVSLVSFLAKLHLVKHKYPTMKKYLREADEYRHSLQLLITRWWKLIPLILISVGTSMVYLSLPFFAILAIAGPETVMASNALPELWIKTCCLTMISYYAASLLPTPGNSGGSEAATIIVFSVVATSLGNVLSWVVLLWRFATYYVYILSGIGINIFEIIRSAVRNRRALKKAGTKT